LVEALLDELPEDNQATVITVKQENMPTQQPTTNGQNPSSSSIKYDPGVAFILEFCTLIATRDEETTEAMGKQVFDTLQGVLRDASQWHPITVSRVVFYALRVLKASYVSSAQNRIKVSDADLPRS
jgi:golgi-specific brefeldin A-resistance guanine nucleotide exchange factor 1